MLNSFRFHHIGYAVKDIEKTSRYYTNASWSLSEVQVEENQNVKIAFLSKPSVPLIELVAPLNDTSPITSIIKRNNGVSTYHICYEVDDIDAALSELRKMQYIVLFEPLIIATMNCKICYLYNKHVGLIEIIETEFSLLSHKE